MAAKKAAELKCGQMAHVMKATGKMIKLMEKEPSCTLMEMFTVGSGSTIKPMVMASMSMPMELYTSENGSKINNTDKV
jgi:hypothetical protein